MFKIGVTTFLVTLAVARSELPVNSYLPPKTRGPDVNGGQAEPTFARHETPSAFRNEGGSGVNRNAGATSYRGNAGNGPSKLYDAPIVVGGTTAGGNSLGGSRGNGFVGGQPPASSYGVPSGGNGRPLSAYGVPRTDGANNEGDFVNGDGRSSSAYGVPRASDRDKSDRGFGGNGVRMPSTGYDAFSTSGNHGGNSDGGSGYENGGVPPEIGYGVLPGAANGNHGGNVRPSSSYGVPGANGNDFANRNDRGRLNGGDNDAGTSNGYEPPRGGSVAGRNGINELGGSGGGLYGTPDRTRNNNNGAANGDNYPSAGPSRDMGNLDNGGANFGNGGTVGGGYNDNAQDESTESVKYEFSYEVKDERSGSDYGHKETREGDRAQGEFNVLLPDGRKQIVEYEADQDGFKPQIRYEGEANTDGYGSGKPNSNNGYSSDRPDSGGFADKSRFNESSSNGGYPNNGPDERRSNGFNSGGDNGYQIGRPGQSFDRDNNNGLSVGFFSDALSNNIDDAFSGSRDNGNVGSNGENGNDGYRY